MFVSGACMGDEWGKGGWEGGGDKSWSKYFTT